MKVTRTIGEIVIRLETTGERDALIAGLDLDRNDPTRRQLYDELRAYRTADAGQHDGQPSVYRSGQAAGYAWLAGPGHGYLDPEETSDAPFPEYPDVLFRQGFSDAVKNVGWHVRNLGRMCADGPSCPDLAWLDARRNIVRKAGAEQ